MVNMRHATKSSLILYEKPSQKAHHFEEFFLLMLLILLLLSVVEIILFNVHSIIAEWFSQIFENLFHDINNNVLTSHSTEK